MSDSSAPRFDFWGFARASFALLHKNTEEIRHLCEVVSKLARTPGPPGRDGEPGGITQVRAWADRVYEKLDLVTHDGSLWQAKQQTGKEPPHSDWVLIVEKGASAAEISPQRTFKPDGDYKRLSLVNHDGASWIAVRDNPGTPGDGDGWQILATRGPQGREGKTGQQGQRGLPGEAAPRHIGWQTDPTAYLAVPVWSDGSEGAPLNVRVFFEQFQRDVGL